MLPNVRIFCGEHLVGAWSEKLRRLVFYPAVGRVELDDIETSAAAVKEAVKLAEQHNCYRKGADVGDGAGRMAALQRWVDNIEELCVKHGMDPEEKDKLGWLMWRLRVAGQEQRPSLNEAYAASLLEQLTHFYREPVMPVSRYCTALETWARAVQQCHDGRLLELAKHFDSIALAIRKSNLLFRLIYLGEEIRTVACPVHEGVWSGCKPDGTCKCMSGFNVTGWLPNEERG